MLPNAILSARPPTASAPVMPPAPVRPLGGAGTAAPARGGGRAMPSAIAPPAELPKRGRPDKAEREKEKRRAASERIAAFADTKPSKRAVREYFAMRIAELKDD